jgi:bacteriorhodopsin
MQSLTAFFFAFIFNLAQDLSVDDVYKWLFRALSLVSLLLVVYINWNKARDRWRKNKSDEQA